MGTLFSALDIGRAGLFAAQVQLDTAGHNIANVNKEGFTRQRVDLTTREPAQFSYGYIGRGPAIDGIRRIRDVFLDTVFRQQAPSLGSADAQASYFVRIEDLFQEPGVNGFSGNLDSFFDALNDFASNVEELPARVSLLSEGEAIAGSLRDASQFLRSLRTNANEEVRNLVPEINSIGDHISKLNFAIRAAEATGPPANDLRDDRDLLLDQLADLVNIRAIERDNGQVDVLLGGDSFVTGSNFRELAAVPDPSLDPVRTDLLAVRFADNGQAVGLSSGRLHGVLQIRDVEIARVENRIDAMASSLIREMNNIHASGNGLSFINAAISSTNAVNSGATALGAAGLPFAVQDGSLDINIYDESTQPPTLSQTITIPITAATTTLDDIRAAIDASPLLSASVGTNGILTITPNANASFSFANDSSGVLAAMGLNSFFTGTRAHDIAVNADLDDHPEWVSSGASLDPLETGDNSVALALAALRTTATLEGDTQTLGEYFQSTIVEVGIHSRANLDERDVQRAFIADYQARRQEVGGVSLDEETTNLMQFQRAFEASARVITVTDRMLETLLNIAF